MIAVSSSSAISKTFISPVTSNMRRIFGAKFVSLSFPPRLERDLKDIDGIMSTERVINSFKNYFKRAEIDLKKVAALANPDLHKLASKL
jgi:hypothetical protein